MHGWVNVQSVNVIHYSNRLKNKNHRILSIDTKKNNLTKSNTIHDKNSTHIRNKGNLFTLINSIHKELTLY